MIPFEGILVNNGVISSQHLEKDIISISGCMRNILVERVPVRIYIYILPPSPNRLEGPGRGPGRVLRRRQSGGNYHPSPNRPRLRVVHVQVVPLTF